MRCLEIAIIWINFIFFAAAMALFLPIAMQLGSGL